MAIELLKKGRLGRKLVFVVGLLFLVGMFLRRFNVYSKAKKRGLMIILDDTILKEVR